MIGTKIVKGPVYFKVNMFPNNIESQSFVKILETDKDDLNSSIVDLTNAFKIFNDFLGKHLICLSQGLYIVLDKEKLTDSKRFFEEMDGWIFNIRLAYDALVNSDLVRPSLEKTMTADPNKKLNLAKTLFEFLTIEDLADKSEKLLRELDRFDFLLLKINVHLLAKQKDFINTELPEGFLMWKIYYYFMLGKS